MQNNCSHVFSCFIVHKYLFIFRLKKYMKKRTNKRSDDKNDVNSKTAASRNHEVRYLMYGNDDGADGDSEE